MSGETLGDLKRRNMGEMLAEKAHELFKTCDKDGKGVVTKRDMQHLIGELPLSADQLEIVFDSLDKDGNGFLTVEEFTDGFGNIEEEEEECNEDAFDHLLNQLGGRDLLEEEDNVRQIWTHLRDFNADVCRKFEDVLGKLIQEIKTFKMENVDLESALKSRMNQHDEEVTQLYEEMERQLNAEKEHLLAEERAKEKRIREELEKELSIKEKSLQDLLTKQSEMEKKLSVITSTGSETKLENAKLQKERDALEQRLQEAECLVQEMQRHVDVLRHETLKDKRKRATATLQVTEGIALERETLVRELDALRSANKQLLDEKDSLKSSFDCQRKTEEEVELKAFHRPQEDNASNILAAPTATTRGTLMKQGSVLSDYIGSNPGTPRTSSYSGVTCDEKELDDINEEAGVTIESCGDVAKWINDKSNQEGCAKEKFHLDTGNKQAAKENETIADADALTIPSMRNISTLTTEHGSQVVWKVKCIFYPEAVSDADDKTHEARSEWKSKKIYHSFCDGETRCFVPEMEEVVKVKRSICQSLSNSTGKTEMNAQQYWKVHLTIFPVSIIPLTEDNFNKEDIDYLNHEKTQTPVSPERVFKIVFVGDSGVGKSSFIQRFCHNQFRPHYSATIGVDFQVKSVEVGGRTIALQFWDTAGQERFRSITKQYFRKADGIIAMYDITSEASFRSVRGWINSIKDDTSEIAVMLLIGNKLDLTEENDNRMVKEKDGRQLAKEFEAIFYETSSCTGHEVEHSVMEMASLLQVKEDEELERVLRLQEVPKKNKCC